VWAAIKNWTDLGGLHVFYVPDFDTPGLEGGICLRMDGTWTNTLSDRWKSLAVVSATPCTTVSQTSIVGITHSCMQIPTHRGHLLRFDRGQATDLMAATIPI
jgi:hypothetical protein